MLPCDEADAALLQPCNCSLSVALGFQVQHDHLLQSNQSPLYRAFAFSFQTLWILLLQVFVVSVMLSWLGMVQFKALSYFCMNPSSERDITDEVHINSVVERKAMQCQSYQEPDALLLKSPKQTA